MAGVAIGADIQTGAGNPLLLMAGPCVLESEDMAREVAATVQELASRLGISYVFKASYRKANRSRLDSFTGIGDLKALKILEKVKEKLSIPIVTDIHTEEEAVIAADYADILQIPAFLCRQTNLLVAAAKTGKNVNIKSSGVLNMKDSLGSVGTSPTQKTLTK